METLTELYAAHSGKVSDKWQLYLRVYEELFSGRRADACRLLEIGIQNGGSLALWAKYFPNATHIVGCDIDPACKALVYDDARIRIVAADANSPEAMKQIDSISDAFDIVIDDGSHVPRDVIASFLNYFPRLSPGGLYVAEDLHCDYFASHDGGILEPYTATNFFGCLVKLMSRTYWRDQLPPKDFAKLFFGGGSLPRFVKEDWIDSITFLDSLVVVRRAMIPGGSRLGHRVIVGDAAIVCADVLRIRKNLEQKPPDAIDRAQAMHDPLNEPDGLAVLNAAFKAWQRGDTATAESQCRKAIALGQDDARAWTLLGERSARARSGRRRSGIAPRRRARPAVSRRAFSDGQPASSARCVRRRIRILPARSGPGTFEHERDEQSRARPRRKGRPRGCNRGLAGCAAPRARSPAIRSQSCPCTGPCRTPSRGIRHLRGASASIPRRRSEHVGPARYLPVSPGGSPGLEFMLRTIPRPRTRRHVDTGKYRVDAERGA